MPRPGPALGRVFPMMITGPGRWAVARHAIDMKSTQWSLIFSGQAQFLKGIKVKETLGELDSEGSSSLRHFCSADTPGTSSHHDSAILYHHQVGGRSELQYFLSEPSPRLPAQLQLCLRVSQREELRGWHWGWLWEQEPPWPRGQQENLCQRGLPLQPGRLWGCWLWDGSQRRHRVQGGEYL